MNFAVICKFLFFKDSSDDVKRRASALQLSSLCVTADQLASVHL